MIELPTAALKGAVATLSGILPPKGLNPGDNCLLAEQDERGLTLSAQSSDTALRTRLAADGEIGLPRLGIPAALLNGFLAGLESDTVTLEIEGKRLTVKGGKARCQIALVLGEDLPDPVLGTPPDETITLATLPARELLAIRRVMHARGGGVNAGGGSKTYSAPQFQGVAVILGDHPRLVATDGFRMGLIRLDGVQGGGVDVTVAQQCLGPLTGLLSAVGGDVFAHKHKGRLVVEGADWYGSFGVYSENLPDVLPLLENQKAVLNIDLDRRGLLAALGRLRLFQDDDRRAVFEFFGDYLRLTTVSQERGEYEETILLSGKEGPDATHHYRPSQVADALSACQEDKVNFAITATGRLLVTDTTGFLAMITPLHKETE